MLSLDFMHRQQSRFSVRLPFSSLLETDSVTRKTRCYFAVVRCFRTRSSPLALSAAALHKSTIFGAHYVPITGTEGSARSSSGSGSRCRSRRSQACSGQYAWRVRCSLCKAIHDFPTESGCFGIQCCSWWGTPRD